MIETHTVIQWVWEGLMSVGLAWVAVRTGRVDRMRTDLERMSRELVSAEIVKQTLDLNLNLKLLAQEIQTINTRLQRGDDEFADLGKGGVEIKMSLMQKVDQLKDYVRDKCASKDDLHELNKRFDGMQRAIAKDLMERRD